MRTSKRRAQLTAERARELLIYNPDDGSLTWRTGSRRRRAGAPAGGLMSNGYRKIILDAGAYSAHRLAWLYVHGKWPDGFIDHINGDARDNRISNLRECNGAQNQANRAMNRNHKTGIKGVQFRKSSGRFIAAIQLGSFDTAEEAAAVYQRVQRFLHGEFCPAPGRSIGPSMGATDTFNRRQRKREAAAQALNGGAT